MKYCSYETRKVIECVSDYGIVIDDSEYINIEVCAGRFWSTQMTSTITKVMTGGNSANKVAKATLNGWSYFEKPIISLLTPRVVAHRTDVLELNVDEWNIQVYNLLTSNFLLTDFNMKELDIIVNEIPTMTKELSDLTAAMTQARNQDVRNVAYLAAIVRRQYQTRQGRIKEIQAMMVDAGWGKPDNYEKIDTIDRMELASGWQEKLREAEITKGLDFAENQRHSER